MRCLKTRFLPSSVSEATFFWVFTCLNSLSGFSGSSAISFEHNKQIAFPNISATQNIPQKDPATDRFCFSHDCFSGLQLGPAQGRNKVRWRPGQEVSLAPHIRTWGLLEANVIYWKSTCDIVETFRRPPQWFVARWNTPPLQPSLRLWSCLNQTTYSAKQQSKFSIILRAVDLVQKSWRLKAFQK